METPTGNRGHMYLSLHLSLSPRREMMLTRDRCTCYLGYKRTQCDTPPLHQLHALASMIAVAAPLLLERCCSASTCELLPGPCGPARHHHHHRYSHRRHHHHHRFQSLGAPAESTATARCRCKTCSRTRGYRQCETRHRLLLAIEQHKLARQTRLVDTRCCCRFQRQQ